MLGGKNNLYQVYEENPATQVGNDNKAGMRFHIGRLKV